MQSRVDGRADRGRGDFLPAGAGISEPVARRLIALGFTLDTFEKITDAAILAEATAAVEARFDSLA